MARLSSPRVGGPIGEQIRVEIKRHHHRFVFWLQHLIQKRNRGFFFLANHEFFAAAGIDQQAHSDRKSFFIGEERKFLFDAILVDVEIFLFEIGNDAVVMIAHGGIDIYEADADSNLAGNCLLSGLFARAAARGARQKIKPAATAMIAAAAAKRLTRMGNSSDFTSLDLDAAGKSEDARRKISRDDYSTAKSWRCWDWGVSPKLCRQPAQRGQRPLDSTTSFCSWAGQIGRNSQLLQ